VDVITEGQGVALGNFSPGKQVLILHRGRIDPLWMHKGGGPESDFIDHGTLVTVLRSQRYDVAAIASAPSTGLDRKVREALLLFIPMGMICGLVLAGAVFYLARIHLSMPVELRVAARRKEFFVEYQPVVDLNTREWVGAEALVRWQRYGEIVRPDLFIPVAEDCGVIKLITECLLAQVAVDLLLLLREDLTFRLAINLSAEDLRSSSTLDALQRLLTASGAPPSQLIVEATEHGFLEDASVPTIINGIRALGIDVAIDDFETGHSSLSVLEKLNVSDLKIDRSFVETIGTDGATSQVVVHIILMAHALNLEMTAEGIETEEQAQFLAERGVRFAQGWLFGRPMRLKAILSRMEERKLRQTLQFKL